MNYNNLYKLVEIVNASGDKIVSPISGLRLLTAARKAGEALESVNALKENIIKEANEQLAALASEHGVTDELLKTEGYVAPKEYSERRAELIAKADTDIAAAFAEDPGIEIRLGVDVFGDCGIPLKLSDLAGLGDIVVVPENGG